VPDEHEYKYWFLKGFTNSLYLRSISMPRFVNTGNLCYSNDKRSEKISHEIGSDVVEGGTPESVRNFSKAEFRASLKIENDLLNYNFYTMNFCNWLKTNVEEE
jgi:hypothetical protein